MALRCGVLVGCTSAEVRRRPVGPGRPDGPTNAAKGDDPAAWRPRKAFQCEYAEHWIAVKSRWSLSVDRSERRALEEMLGRC